MKIDDTNLDKIKCAQFGKKRQHKQGNKMAVLS